MSRLRAHTGWDDLYNRVLETSLECSESWAGLSEDTKLETLEALRLLNVGNGAEVCNNANNGDDSESSSGGVGGAVIAAIVVPILLIAALCGGFLFFKKKNVMASAVADVSSGGRQGGARGKKGNKSNSSVDDDRNMCVICMDGRRSHIFTSCGHKCVCEACAVGLERSQQKACPMCRMVTTSIVKVFE